MKKRMVALIIMIFMLISSVVTTFAYTELPQNYELPFDALVSVNNAVVENDISINANGVATFDMFLPFACTGVTVYYQTNVDANLKFVLDGNTHQIPLVSSSISYAYTFPQSELVGEKSLVLTSVTPITISRIVFNKAPLKYPANYTWVLPNITDFERQIETAVILKKDASILRVNGAKRYINYDDAKETPLMHNGSVYLPIMTLARAFGYYYEDMPDKGYVFLRKDNYEFYHLDDKSYSRINSTSYSEVSGQIVYKDGKTFGALRYFAEAAGKTVGYRDGLIVIDNSYNTKHILNSDVYTSLTSEFNGYIPSKVSGKTYYVAQTETALDSNNGTEQQPFLTLSKAADIAVAGDTVIIKSGEYREILKPKNSGTPTKPITFRAGEGENVVISANEKISSFVSYKPNVVVGTMNWDMGKGKNQIFYKGEALAEGRHPNTDTSVRQMPEALSNLGPLWMTFGNIQVSKTNNKEALSTYTGTGPLSDLRQAKDYWKGGTLVSLHGWGWSVGMAKIEGSSWTGVGNLGTGKLTLGDTSTLWWYDNAEHAKATDSAYITGHINTVDTPGEWYVESNKIFMYLPTGETEQSLQLEVKKRQLVVDLSGKSYIQLQGINTIGGGMKLNDSEMSVIKDGTMRYISHYTFSNDQRDGFIDDRNIQDPNGAPMRGEVGIFISGKDNAVINSTIDYSAAAGIYMTGVHTYVENNIISNCGYMGSYVGGLFTNTEAWKAIDTPRGGHGIFSNSVFNTGRMAYGVSTNDSWAYTNRTIPPILPDEVAYNEFYNASILTRDTGISYAYAVMLGTEKLRTKFHNNLVYDSWCSDGFNAGIYYDNYCQEVEVYNNIIFNTAAQSFMQAPIYIQTKEMYPDSFATADMWGNQTLGLRTGGKDSIDISEYPNEKAFKSGSSIGKPEYSVNYNLLTQQSTQQVSALTYSAEQAVLSDGVALQDGVAYFNDDNQYILFEGVEFTEDLNQVTVNYRGDSRNTGDKLELVIGDSLETGKTYVLTDLKATSSYQDVSYSLSQLVKGVSGVNNVYILTDDYKSGAVESIKLGYQEFDRSIVAQVYGGEYTDFVAGDKALVPGKNYGVGLDTINAFVNNTWAGTILHYKDVELTESANTFVVTASTGPPWSGNIMKVRLGSPTAAPICQTVINGQSWGEYPEIEVKLKEPLAKGKYDVYLTFEVEGMSSNIYWLGFKNTKD